MNWLKIAAALLAALVATSAAAQNDACVIYEHRNYGGDSYGFSERGESRRYGRFWNDRVSAVRVAPGCRLTLFAHHDFGGDAITFEGDVSYVGGRWNDRASSSTCECERRRPPPRAGGGGGGPDAAIGRGDPPRLSRRGFACNLFRNPDFTGQWRAFRDGEDDKRLGRRLREQVSSVEVARGCVAVIDVGEPYKIWVDENVARFPRGVNNSAESVSCFCER